MNMFHGAKVALPGNELPGVWTDAAVSWRQFARILWFVPLLVSGCATYHPQPLPTAPDLMRSPALTVPVSKLDLPGLKPHPLDPAKGLDETAVVTLAVLHNPDLKAARLQAGVAEAQLLEAGLLPDPVVSGGLSQSTLRTGYAVGLSEDLQALITRGAAKAAAQAQVRRVNLEILWQEWQVADRARELFIQTRADDELREVLAVSRDLLNERCQRDKTALQYGDVTAVTVSADLAALAEAQATLRQLQLQANQTRHELDQLLGLKPDTPIRLTGGSQIQPLSSAEFQAAVAALPRRRADLLALQAGYQSQEEKLREVILAQFPAISAGVEQAKSAEEGIHTVGLTVNVTLPLFNRNRGQIALQQATRALLWQTYQARLDQAVNQADQLWQAVRLMARQQADLQKRLAQLEKMAAAAERSFRLGNLDAGTYAGMELNFRTAQAEAIRLRAALERAEAALQLLLGLPLASSS
ncbi:MAG TPA: TolC family protein [Verrucomicrobiae bacterium]|nr:TolC family protein [Verrucomicrobiae bacterium]